MAKRSSQIGSHKVENLKPCRCSSRWLCLSTKELRVQQADVLVEVDCSQLRHLFEVLFSRREICQLGFIGSCQIRALSPEERQQPMRSRGQFIMGVTLSRTRRGALSNLMARCVLVRCAFSLCASLQMTRSNRSAQYGLRRLSTSSGSSFSSSSSVGASSLVVAGRVRCGVGTSSVSSYSV